MGEVKDTVKGSSKPKKKAKASDGNLIERVEDLRAEVSRLTAIKDDDTLSEGDSAKAENVRKAALLRAVHSLMTASKVLLEEY